MGDRLAEFEILALKEKKKRMTDSLGDNGAEAATSSSFSEYCI